MKGSRVLLNSLQDHRACFDQLIHLEPGISKAGELILQTLKSEGKVLVCGNGGSAADAQHFAAELVGRFEVERRAFGAVALTTDTSIMTAIANDYDFNQVFARQVAGLGRRGDSLVGISTSGMSDNVKEAFIAARVQGLFTIGLLGREGGSIKELSDIAIVVPADCTARIQEAHIFILHVWAAMIEQGMADYPRMGS